MTTDVYTFDETGVRRISETVNKVLGTQLADPLSLNPSEAALPVMVQPLQTLRSLEKFMTSTFDVSLWTLDGEAFSDLKSAEPVRLITNGRQIALPVSGIGLCVADAAFWAVNVGSLPGATHPLTGHSIGRAALLRILPNGNLEVTEERADFVHRDNNTVQDGTLIQLSYVSGSLTIVWAACGSHASLTGLSAEPPEEETPP